MVSDRDRAAPPSPDIWRPGCPAPLPSCGQRRRSLRRGFRCPLARVTRVGSSGVIEDVRGAFRRLHKTGTFVLPNPWDVPSARLLEQLGFPALATTSSG